MGKTEDEVLIGALSSAGNKRNLLLFGLGGMLATKLFERLQPTEKYELTVGVPQDASAVKAATLSILQGMGKIVAVGPEVDANSLSAVVGMRFIATNPAVINVQFRPTSDRSSNVVIKGLSKEPLLWKQRSAQKAVEKVRARLLGEPIDAV